MLTDVTHPSYTPHATVMALYYLDTGKYEAAAPNSLLNDEMLSTYVNVMSAISSTLLVNFLKSFIAFLATENLTFGKPRVFPEINSFSIIALYLLIIS